MDSTVYVKWYLSYSDITIPREMVDIVIESNYFLILWYTMFVDLQM